ncbi:GTP cyclohydrolase I [Frankia sp. ACN1ag]|uniref:GTP cyclohydrolase I n=1 Tax=Frankia sp. ACN1ag TaxID=102891 RepID=UPI0006DC875D|nr:GTP cyclohydrolase I FolE [Frankia sp. ACN1ag]KQC37876.1 GTP cyclohydrolase [Frankia sp. ACN1ag]
MTSTSTSSPTAAESSAVSALSVPAVSVPVPRIDTGRVSDLIAQLLVALGEDSAREGLIGTPERVASWWNTFLSSDSAATATCFTESHVSGQMVVVGGMSVWSLCEHHLLPMNLQVTAGYVPTGQLLGLSKFGRIAQRHAGRLQVQERFTRQVADELASVIGSDDVAVAVRGTHLCMSMRGVRMEAARTRTLCAGGRFASDLLLSQQFLALAHPHTHPE